jgi:hypothetical protein
VKHWIYCLGPDLAKLPDPAISNQLMGDLRKYPGLLEQGASFEQVADILGNSPDVVRRHYGKWPKAARQTSTAS